jgi:hypothetical protein
VVDGTLRCSEEVHVKRWLQLLVIFMAVVVVALPGYAAQKRVHAELSGDEEVPPVKTAAKGDFKLLIYRDALSFELDVDNITNPTGAYIHKGRKGENGPAVAGFSADQPRRGLSAVYWQRGGSRKRVCLASCRESGSPTWSGC